MPELYNNALFCVRCRSPLPSTPCVLLVSWTFSVQKAFGSTLFVMAMFLALLNLQETCPLAAPSAPRDYCVVVPALWSIGT